MLCKNRGLAGSAHIVYLLRWSPLVPDHTVCRDLVEA
jgi:hypothetical protein